MQCITDFDGTICIRCISKYSSRMGLDPKNIRPMRGFLLDFCRLLVKFGQAQVVHGLFW